MENINSKLFEGERSLFNSKQLEIQNTVFKNGESPLKESQNIILKNSIFGWKYPLWYCENIYLNHTTLLETARSGIWYTNHIKIENSIIEAPKTFRRGHDITLKDVFLSNASETFWNCSDIVLEHVQAKGDYFGKNSENIVLKNVLIDGNYAFDGAKNIEIHDSQLLSKDAFWNCENVVIYDSVLIGEYLGWNSKNLTLINCTVESNQGLCYIENLIIRNSKLINTDLAFEYPTIDVESLTPITSIKNPISGQIKAPEIETIILDESIINPLKTKICLTQKCVMVS